MHIIWRREGKDKECQFYIFEVSFIFYILENKF